MCICLAKADTPYVSLCFKQIPIRLEFDAMQHRPDITRNASHAILNFSSMYLCSSIYVFDFCVSCRGSSKNYVDRIWAFSDHLPPSSGHKRPFSLVFIVYHVTYSGHFADHLPTSSCPRSFWMTPMRIRCIHLFILM